MPVRRIDLGITDVALVVEQGLDDLAAARGGETPVGGEADQQEFRRGSRQRPSQVAAEGPRGVKVIQCAGDQQIGVRVEVFAEFVALVAQVTFDLKLDLLC